MKIFYRALFTCALLSLLGCNGSSGKNDTVTGQTPVSPSKLTLSLVDAQGNQKLSFDKNEAIYVKALVQGASNQNISGSRVDFTNDLGLLSVNSKLTDAKGTAEITIGNTNNALGAGTLTASVDGISQAIDYEFIDNQTHGLSPKLQISLEVSGTPANQFGTDEHGIFTVKLLTKDGSPIDNKKINFTTDIGSLEPSSAQTNAQGYATTKISSTVLGAGMFTATLDDNSAISAQQGFQVLATNSTGDNDIRIGHISDDGQFNEGQIKLSVTDGKISAGGTLGLWVDLIDSNNQLVNTPITVSFTSTCVANNNANIDQTVITIRGKASSTFEDVNCAGVSGTEDVIIASINANGVTSTASAIIDIQGEQLGSIEFVSTSPNQIVIKGSGGQENATVTFLIKSAIGNPIAQQEVIFDLDSQVGGVKLSRTKGVTNSQGLVTTQVISGTVPAVIRVSAKASLEGEEISTQSSELSINTGLPDQASMTIAASVLNPEASTRGSESIITVWLADSYNNPVADGTTINFTTEGGSIEERCTTTGGNCSVTWTATEPYPNDHRATILATASGHETFFDTNGNNQFDDADGSAINLTSVNSGFGRSTPQASGFVDMSEAWRDDNANGIKDANETKYFDDNGNGQFDAPDDKFNGPQCQGTSCDATAKKITIRKAMEIIMSDAYNPTYKLTNDQNSITYLSSYGQSSTLPEIADGSKVYFVFHVADSAMQTLPVGTIIDVELDGVIIDTREIADTNRSPGFSTIRFPMENIAGGSSKDVNLTITIKTNDTLAKPYISTEFKFL
ncbi:Ig-like domain-containing protein [Thalassotalea marina]|uniref:Big-1 domain-containing protein n=1 Tax=Thalassotalea marina TaxID=1673741 RepID=A0A919EIE1_9GAMM|nr:Ig-like domain-containing protein [Thalassotalea marina]GHF84097.1 hypothetical protein GCM10017161_09350 [Thalassotalea marina]